MKRKWMVWLVLPVLALRLALPGAALFWWGEKEEPEVADLTKNGLVGSVIGFSQEDFRILNGKKLTLTAVVVEELPDPGVGTLLLGGQSLEVGSRVEGSALSGLRFQSKADPTEYETEFSLLPIFSNGKQGDDFEVEITLLTKQNDPPVARNMELSTYKNISLTGYFDAVDSEGEPLTFRVMSNPARGAVTLAEDGSGAFVYRPYENKTGKDVFTYVAEDPAGNRSGEATVTVRIERASTPVTYADMEDHPAHKSAIRLAQEGIYVGVRMGETYLFDPGRTVSRAQFLSMAMEVAQLEPLKDVTLTGFEDDEAIPTWSKGCVSAALLAGAVTGSRDESGAPVFRGEEPITRAQASVMLDRLLSVSDVPVEVFGPEIRGHWAGQAMADLAAWGVLREVDSGEEVLDLGDVALMLDSCLELLDRRER